MPSKRVFIVGSGPCGLVAIKEMLEAGHQVTCVDRSSHVGGLFSTNPDGTYDLHLTISNMFMAFSDFPPPEQYPRYSSKEEYAEYLASYVDHFDLRRHVSLDTNVLKATLEGNGEWKIITQGVKNKRETIHVADYLIVATGSNHIPKVPDFPGFTGKIEHSSTYRVPDAYKGKRVLVVGGGESSSDLSAQIGKVAKKVHVWLRRPIIYAPRLLGYPKGYHYEDDVLRARAAENRPVGSFLEQNGIARWKVGNPVVSTACMLGPFFASSENKGPPGIQVMCRINNLAIKNDWWQIDQSQVVAKTLVLTGAAARGDCDIVVTKEVKFKGKTVEFVKPTIIGQNPTLTPESFSTEVDVIMACIGFQTDVSWIETSTMPELSPNPRTWYRHAYPPKLGDKLAFFGWARPQQGGIPQCAEMLARYTAMLLQGTRKLPKDYAERALKEAACERQYYSLSPDYNSLVAYMGFMNAIARDIGCVPNIPWFSPGNFLKLWLFPGWSCFYRLNGPGANPKAAYDLLDRFPADLSPFMGPHGTIAPAIVPDLVFAIFLAWPLNVITYFFGPIWDLGNRRALIRGHRFMTSRFYLLHGNELRFQDLFRPESGILGPLLVPVILAAFVYTLVVRFQLLALLSAWMSS